jgi:SAM-dependent methyltransferase
VSVSPPERGFDELAADYQQLLDDPARQAFADDPAFFIHQKCRALLRHLERELPGGPRRVLDAGCGQGTALEYLRTTCTVFGSDVSREMLRAAVRRRPVVVQEPFALPFRTASFDAAFAFCVYHHIDTAHHVRHLGEMGRVVRPSGRVVVFEHNPLNPVTRRVFARAPIDRGCHLIPRRRLQAVFAEAGFEDIRHGYVLFLPQRLERFAEFESVLERVPFGGQYYVSGRRA